MKILDIVKGNMNPALLVSAAYNPSTPYKGKLPAKTVKKGLKGANVKYLQQFLNWAMKAKLKVDGYCGSKTVSAIKQFQKRYGLKVDGVFGPASLKKAKAIVKAHQPKSTSKVTPKPASKPTPKPTPKKTNAQKIVDNVNKFCWPYGTNSSKYKYPNGDAKSAYKVALKKYMKKSAKISQTDCGYFSSTCVRAAGLGNFLCLPGDAKNPYPKLPSTLKIVHNGGKITLSMLKPGDIIRYKKKNGHQHTVIYLGNGKIAEAQRGHAFPAIKKNTQKYNKSNVKINTLQIVRAKEK